MPIKVNYFSKRFDFGVPLEDIFPPNDIHPRLKYVFEEAYKGFIRSNFNIERVVRQLQGSLEARLELKCKLIHDLHYDINTGNVERTPGAYFWVIRHFLGLLPIPLFPTYSKQIRFDWIGLSEKCRNFLQYYESERDRKYKLDYEFAENLNLLPFEHFLLLTIMVHFIRKISKKAANGRQISRRSLVFLCKYFSAATCIRPYTPGYKEGKLFPLFFYIVLRWREIEKYCRIIGHPVYFLENSCLNYESYPGFRIRDNWAQTANFSPEVITVYKTVPYFCDNNNYLRDICCQTEQTSLADKCIQMSELYGLQETNVDSKNDSLSDQESFHPSLLDVEVYDDKNIIEHTSSPIETKNSKIRVKNSVKSNEDVISKMGWSDVVKQTANTIKKVEEYIYDDYDTFNKEEYNQISEINKNKGSVMQKVAKLGWTYTPENSARDERKRSSSDNDEAEDTYVKFEDLFDENGGYKTNGEHEYNTEPKVEENKLNSPRKWNGSKTFLYKNGSFNSANKKEDGQEKIKKNFNLKRFKLKLNFLRVLTPRRAAYSSPSVDSVTSNVKYKRIKNKSNTL